MMSWITGRYLARNQTLMLAKMQERLNAKRLAARGLINGALDVAMTATHESLAAAFEVSWEDLGNEAVFKSPVGEYARQLGALLSLFAVAPIVWKWVVDCLPDWDEEDLEAARDEGLMGSHLLQMNGDNTYQLHPIVREFLAVKCDEMSVKAEFQESFKEIILFEAERSIESPEKSLILECELVISHVQELIKQTEYSGVEEEIAIAVDSLAYLYESMGKYSEAEALYVRSLSIVERQLGVNHLRTALQLNNLALLYKSMGKYSEAEPLYLRSLAIREQQLESNDPKIALNLNNLAMLYYAMGKYTKAEPLLIRSLAIREQQLEYDHPDIAQSLSNLAELYRGMGKYSKSESLLIRAIDIYERRLGSDHPNIAQTLNNLAALYCAMERYSEAEALLIRSLGICEQHLGSNHPNTALNLNNLAGLYQSIGKHIDAEPLYVRSLAICEQQLGIDHPNTQSVRENLERLRSLISSDDRS